MRNKYEVPFSLFIWGMGLSLFNAMLFKNATISDVVSFLTSAFLDVSFVYIAYLIGKKIEAEENLK